MNMRFVVVHVSASGPSRRSPVFDKSVAAGGEADFPRATSSRRPRSGPAPIAENRGLDQAPAGPAGAQAGVHMRRRRAPISTLSRFALAPAFASAAMGQAQLVKRSRIVAGMKRVRAAYMWRSPLLRC
jgi:hypothetical protein